MKATITLIGMPGAGKSTIGIILAKYLSYGFIDTDILIQINHRKSLQAIMNDSDYMNLRKIEAREIQKINITHHVIATGGSVVYSDDAMQHLKRISTLIFLKVGYEELKKRIHNFETRGIAKSGNQSFYDLFNERQVLYRKYADITVDCYNLDQEEIAEFIALKFSDY